MKIGEQLKLLRLDIGLTQKELGRQVKMPDSQIRKYESGSLKPKGDTLEKILDKLFISYFIVSKKRDIKKTNISINQKGEIYYFDLDDDFCDKLSLDKNKNQFKELLNFVQNMQSDSMDYLVKKISYQSNKLNEEGKNKVLNYMDDLLSIPKYTK